MGAMNRTHLQLAAAFAILLPSVGSLRADDLPRAIVARVAQYNQTSASTPTLKKSLPYMFITEAEGFDAGDVNLMSLALPTTGVFDAEPQNDGGSTESFHFQARYSNLTNFNSAFPTGSYTLTFVPSSGNTVSLPLSIKATAFPTAPKVTNYTAAQTIDPAKSFTLTWGAFTGATSKDRILFGVKTDDDDEYEFIETGTPAGPVGSASNSLAATTKSFVIPAGTLPPGSDCQVEIIFARADVQSSVAQGYFASGAASLTNLKIHTSGALDRTAPKVASSTPKNGATGIATTATVTIVFNEGMRSKWGWNVSFSNLNAAFPTLTWTDNKTLKITPPAGGWPKGKKIGVILNPANSTGTKIQDLSGNALAATTISFTVKS
jgi:hypothetical protein